MKRFYFILLALLMGTTFLSAQETKSNAFGLSVGMGNLQKQDLIFSPFVASDWSPLNVLVQYEHHAKIDQKARVRFGQYSYFVGESFSYYSRDIEYEKYPHSFTNLDLNYSLSTPVYRSANWIISAGGRFRNRFQIANYEFGHAGQFSYHLSMGLDVLLDVGYGTGNHSLNASLALPIFSYLARSPYTGQDDDYLERITVHGDLKIFWEHLKSGSIQSWGTSRMVDFELGYNYALNSTWDIGITYIFFMNLHNSPVQYTSIENVFYLGTTFKF